jgi:hypothetical protein
MMSHNRPELMNTVILPGNVERLNETLEMLDELHDAVSEGSMTTFTDVNATELENWLREVVYMAQETLQEIQKTKTQRKPVLRIVEKVNRAG